VALVREAGFQRRLAGRPIAPQQQRFRAFYPAVDDAVRRQSRGPLEQRLEMRRADGRHAGEALSDRFWPRCSSM